MIVQSPGVEVHGKGTSIKSTFLADMDVQWPEGFHFPPE